MYTLSQEQIDSYNKLGYLHIPVEEHKAFDAETIRRWTYEIKAWPREKGKWMPYDEVNLQGERQLLRTENFTDFHEGMDSVLRNSVLPKLLEQISGSEMLLFKDKINYKAANGNGFCAHLDAPAYDHIAKVEHLTINIAVDDATIENGCLEVVDGSHKVNVDLLNNAINPKWEAAQKWVHVPLKAGDLLIFGSHLAHRSEPNRSNRSRASIYATYSSAFDGRNKRREYYEHRRIAFPPDHERVEGVDYSEGYKRYAFAVPYVKQDA